MQTVIVFTLFFSTFAFLQMSLLTVVYYAVLIASLGHSLILSLRYYSQFTSVHTMVGKWYILHACICVIGCISYSVVKCSVLLVP